MKSSRPKVEPIRQPTLFQIEKLDKAAEPGELEIERPYSLPGILLGTSAFTANGWQGSFYPPGMKSHDFLSYYATQFATVEVDSTFYGCPSARTVNNWAARTPEDYGSREKHDSGTLKCFCASGALSERNSDSAFERSRAASLTLRITPVEGVPTGPPIET